MNKCVSFAVLGLALLLSGCFDMSQELWVHKDGSGRMSYTIGINEQLARLSRDSTQQDICADFYRDKSELEKHKGVQAVNYDSKREGGVQYCTVDIRVQHFTDLIELQTTAMKDTQASRHQADFHTSMELIDHDDGAGHFRLYIENKAGARNQDRLDTQAEHFANVLMAQVMSGRYWTVTLHVPTLTTSNGEVNDKGKAVQWKVPLYDLMTDMNYALDMQASFDVDLPWYKQIWKWIT